MNQGGGLRGQPVATLVVVLGGWVCMRMLTDFVPPGDRPGSLVPGGLQPEAVQAGLAAGPGAEGHLARPASGMSQGMTLARHVGGSPCPASGNGTGDVVMSLDRADPGPPDNQSPADPAAAAHVPEIQIGPPSGEDWPEPERRQQSRLGGNAWVLVRAVTGIPTGTVPTYGGSQAGAVLRHRLGSAPGPGLQAYLRGSAALNARSRDVALGLDWRPRNGLRLDVLGEVRVVETGRSVVVRPAAGLVGQTGPHRLPGGFAASAYAQAGWVGGKGAVTYGDGQVLIERAVSSNAAIDLRLGLAAWSAGQTGVGRVDVGPTVSLSVPRGPAIRARLQADWRQRVAGNAAPGSGPALILATSF